MNFLKHFHGNNIIAWFVLSYLVQTRTTLLQWEGIEVDSRYSDLSEAVHREVKENESFLQYVENYERVYMYNEEDNEPGRCGGNGYLLVGEVKQHRPN